MDMFDAALLNIEDVMPVIKKSHLKLELFSFRKMARSLRGLCSKEGHQRKNTLIHAYHDLFIKLAALCKSCWLTKIVDMEKLGAPLRRGANQARRKVFNSLNCTMHISMVGMCNFCLNAKN